MTGLKLIPAFFLLMVLTYFGIQFVEANREEVVVTIGAWQSRSIALGFVVISSFFIGMVFSAALSLTELLRLYIINHRLKRKLADFERNQPTEISSTAPASDISNVKPSGRFT
ncbi:LapA family protein [bacterium]|nr:LapA family protein [bacterium]NBX82932.1 LapA family protein [bacterium]